MSNDQDSLLHRDIIDNFTQKNACVHARSAHTHAHFFCLDLALEIRLNPKRSAHGFIFSSVSLGSGKQHLKPTCNNVTGQFPATIIRTLYKEKQRATVNYTQLLCDQKSRWFWYISIASPFCWPTGSKMSAATKLEHCFGSCFKQAQSLFL